MRETALTSMVTVCIIAVISGIVAIVVAVAVGNLTAAVQGADYRACLYAADVDYSNVQSAVDAADTCYQAVYGE